MYIQVEMWHWWVLALCFIVIEGMKPSGVFAGMAIAAGVVGGILLKYPYLDISPQLGIFGTITLATLMFVNYVRRKNYMNDSEDTKPSKHTMLGQEFELKMPIQNGIGEVIIGDHHWSLKGPNIKSGTLVRVLQLDGDILMVMPVDIINQRRKEQQEQENNK